jgi:hypothetical protein
VRCEAPATMLISLDSTVGGGGVELLGPVELLQASAVPSITVRTGVRAWVMVSS